jgi:riboflavin synthase
MRIGIADTTFARVDMGNVAIETIKCEDSSIEIERYTVPGFKDLPVAAKKLLEDYQCDIVVAVAWIGTAAIDEVCAQEAGNGLIQAELMTNKHILKVFVHSKESEDVEELIQIAKDRTAKHALNAIALVKGKEELTSRAGRGLRQGKDHEGELR